MDQIRESNVPMFSGLSVSDFLARFDKELPIYEYTPTDQPLHKIPRAYILNVISGWQDLPPIDYPHSRQHEF